LRVEEGQALIQQEGERLHHDQKVIDEQKAEFASHAHYGVVKALTAQGEDIYASKYYDDVKDQITGDQADHAATMVRDGSSANEGLRIARSLAFKEDGTLQDWNKVQDGLGKITDAKTYNAAFEQVNRIRTAQEKATDEADKEAVNDTYNAFLQFGPYAPEYQESLSHVSPKRRFIVNRDIMANAAANARGEKMETDPSTYFDVMHRINEGNCKNVIEECHGQVKFEDMKELMRRQESKDKNDDKDQTKTAILDHAVELSLGTHGIFKPTDKEKTDNATQAMNWYKVHDWVRRAAGQFELDNKHAPSLDDYVKMADDAQSLEDIHGKPTPTYQVPGSLDRPEKLGKEISDSDMSAFHKVLSNPNDETFDANVAKMTRWSMGQTQDGVYDPNLKDRYKQLAKVYIDPYRTDIISNFMQQHNGRAPSESEIIESWSNGMHANAPKPQVAPVSHQDAAVNIDALRYRYAGY